MSNHFNLSIKKPCTENFSSFQPATLGGYCGNCQKNVIDFTKMTDDEIITFFKNRPSNTCGRFLEGQLKNYELPIDKVRPNHFKWLGLGFLGFSLLWPSLDSNAQVETTKDKVVLNSDSHIKHANPTKGDQKHIVKGTVVEEYSNETLPAVNVILKGSTIGTVTDVDGKFEFPEPLYEGDILVFSFIGFETKEYKISKNAPNVIDMTLFAMEIEFMGEVAIEQVYTSKQSWWKKLTSHFR